MVEFVLPDMPRDDLIHARRHIEMPLPALSPVEPPWVVVVPIFKSDFVLPSCTGCSPAQDAGEPLRIVRVLHFVAVISWSNSKPKISRKALYLWLRLPPARL